MEIPSRNNADETLRFVCVSSHKERNTLQPWMTLGNRQNDESGPARLSFVGPSLGQFITVRNWGTAPVTINDTPGTPIGGQQSPVILVSRPSEIAPHGVDHISFRCEQVDVQAEFPHTFDSNDKEPMHTALRIVVTPF